MSRDIRYSLSLSKTPGPGAYEDDYFKLRQKEPQWTVSKSSR